MLNCSSTLSADSRKNSIQHGTDLLREIDSLKIIVNKLSQDRSQPYQEILEKTNQQLSLWSNPYALMIASLAILFTLLTIIAAVIIYSQGKEFKAKIDSFLQGYKELLETLVKDWETRLSQIDKKSVDYQKQLETATGEQKKLIETELNKLKNERDSVSSRIATTVVPMPSSGSMFSFGTNRFHKCSQCGRGFYVDNSNSVFAFGGGSKTVTCPNPKCGNVDELPFGY